MLFTQFEFIFVFVPITLIGYFSISRIFPHPAAQVVWLAAASLVFYGYWDIRFVPIIAISIVVNYLCAERIAASPRGSSRRTTVLIAALSANLLALAVFKYTNFGISTYNAVTGSTVRALPIVLPLGISFFTFTQIAYLVDVYGGYPSERSFSKYVLFVTYFPHLIAGPVLHHGEMMPQFGMEKNRRFSAERFAIGITIFAIGLFKKAVIADGFALIAGPVFARAATGDLAFHDAWYGALAYSLQIYFDFSGYSDMAIGLSTIFRISLPFNFDSPYKSRSIIEFWRRWHISLSRFLRDYLYIPFGGNRRGELMRNVNLTATMLLGGLWHGAGWTFVIWGGLHGLFLVINHAWTRFTPRIPLLARFSTTTTYAIMALLLTQFCVVIAWVFFRATSFDAARRMLSAMFRMEGRDLSQYTSLVDHKALAAIAIGYLICLLLPNVNGLFRDFGVGLNIYKESRVWSLVSLQWEPRTAWALASVGMLALGLFVTLISGDLSPFLYFQF
ncbi:MBOAT family protein [Bradyrhizobium diazoefficiens]|nr:MBOAT family protein [Bradyrhizobium diazoefficiens]MBR0848967.1 MBOAT family protein [Bradyrhizobium diazoefficiens]